MRKSSSRSYFGSIEVGPRGVDDRQMVEHDRVDIDGEAAAFVELAVAAQIDHRSKTQRLERDDVAGCQSVEPVGTKQCAPFRRAPVGRGVATEISEVVHGLEGDQAHRIGGEVGRRVFAVTTFRVPRRIEARSVQPVNCR